MDILHVIKCTFKIVFVFPEQDTMYMEWPCFWVASQTFYLFLPKNFGPFQYTLVFMVFSKVIFLITLWLRNLLLLISYLGYQSCRQVYSVSWIQLLCRTDAGTHKIRPSSLASYLLTTVHKSTALPPSLPSVLLLIWGPQVW